MTITLDELRKILSMPGVNSPFRPAITSAFITETAFSVGNLAYPAVVTAIYIDKPTGRFEITFDALGYTGPAPISLTINEFDIRAVREMLGIGKAFPLADYEQDDLAVALHALHQIADLDQTRTGDDLLYWKNVAITCMDYAQEALASIDFLQEADDGTPSDS